MHLNCDHKRTTQTPSRSLLLALSLTLASPPSPLSSLLSPAGEPHRAPSSISHRIYTRPSPVLSRALIVPADSGSDAICRLRPVTEQLEARATCLPHFSLYSLDSPQNQDPSSSLAHPDACKPYHLRRGQGTHHRKVQLCEPEIPFDKGR
ncbi:hypothetical protein HZS61_009637 [Fusarium oxysporum f. sp. conglutinans]|uniref:Uncharacterized protein n=1 Tax=Fusarium oxysporum f. sp. conglutinans TaxID=100902 RepID=A0A8H6LNR1_FUSOX|nr:hypothetical protein HZS61_009637 [Fusarium oxysporum f. sp. conglutinans]